MSRIVLSNLATTNIFYPIIHPICGFIKYNSMSLYYKSCLLGVMVEP